MVALASTAKELKYVRYLLMELGAEPRPTNLYCDNQSAITISKNGILTSKVKHIDIRHNFIKECINREILKVSFVSTTENLADLFTKPASKNRIYGVIKDMIQITKSENCNNLEMVKNHKKSRNFNKSNQNKTNNRKNKKMRKRHNY